MSVVGLLRNTSSATGGARWLRMRALAAANPQPIMAALTHAFSTLGSGAPRAVFSDAAEYEAALLARGDLPKGFRVGTTSFRFLPEELPTREVGMNMALLALDRPSEAVAAVFTRNAFPGAPVLVGRERIKSSPAIGAIVVNNKVSNVRAQGGVEASESVCAAVAKELGLPSGQYVLPSSTGVIGWKLPVSSMLRAVPDLVASAGSTSGVEFAKAIMTTDTFPKLRSEEIAGGRIVGVAKGAGMVEPNMATMLVFITTDVAISKDALREMLPRITNNTFNCISVDSDTSTSDTLVVISSGLVPFDESPALLAEFEAKLTKVCTELAEDVVRNGEGTHHVMKIRVSGAPTDEIARGVGKSIANSPLFKCAVAGNDPNVGRLVCAIGKYLGRRSEELGSSLAEIPESTSLEMGGIPIYKDGRFVAGSDTEMLLVRHMAEAQLTEAGGGEVTFPRHERAVEVGVDLGMGDCEAVIIGSDLTSEYVAVNADYRS